MPAPPSDASQKIVLWGLGLAGIAGAMYFGKQWVASLRADNEEKKSMVDGSSAAFAKEIKMAFDNDGWWGTDVKKLREVIRRIPSQAVFEDTVNSYSNLFGSSMLRDMADELSASEYIEMMQIKAGKPQKTGGAKPALNLEAMARRLKAAFDLTYGFIPGTDDEAIRAVFNEIPTQTIFIKVGTAYYKQYGKHLTAALKDELGETGYFNMMKMITSKPKG